MSMVWIFILALVAGPDGHSTHPAGESRRPALNSMVRAHSPEQPSRSLSIARRSWHRASSAPWSLTGLDEFDTEELDETWMVQLDALASFPASWLCFSSSRSRSERTSADGFPPPVLGKFPLRC